MICQQFYQDDTLNQFHKLDPDSDENLSNWIEQYDLTCASSEERGLIGTSFFFGIVVGCLSLPKLSDRYGRKPITIIGALCAIIATLLCIFGKSLPILFAS